MLKQSQYNDLKALAREKRTKYSVDTKNFGLQHVRRIYKAEGVRIDHYPHLPKKIKALYMCDDDQYSVAVQKSLPQEPKIFALLHELKHHYCDQDLLKSGYHHCGDFNMTDPIEVGAEIFAAEFIYPIKEFANDVFASRITKWEPPDVVNFKRTCGVKVSYRYLCRRLHEVGAADKEHFKDVKFVNLEHQLYGQPYHLRVRSAAKAGKR